MARRKKIPVTQYQYEALQYLSPPEQLTVSEWAEKYRILDAKSAAMPGPWSNDVTPYLKGVMDEFNNYETEKIVFVKPTQVGGTEALQNMIGYIVMQDPAPTMIVYPTDTLAKSISENRLQPMLKATPEIAKKFDDTSPLLELHFDGMYLTLAGSNSPSGLASKPIRFLMMDEVDKYPGASNKEANPIKLATERTKTFHNKKIFITMDNIFFNVTCENQRRADERIPILFDLPFKHKGIMCAPFIGPVSIRQYLTAGQIEQVICGGENYDGARPCNFDWVKSLRQECVDANVTFCFIETGTVFIKDGRRYHLPSKQLQSRMAYKSGMNFQGRPIHFDLVDDWGYPIPQEDLYVPHFRTNCETCGSKLICNGCSDCGKCL